MFVTQVMLVAPAGAAQLEKKTIQNIFRMAADPDCIEHVHISLESGAIVVSLLHLIESAEISDGLAYDLCENVVKTFPIFENWKVVI